MGEKSKPIRQEPLHKGTCSGSIWVFHGILGSKQGLRRSAKKLHAEGARKRDQLNREKGSRGDFVPFRLSLAGCRDSVPAGVWGNAPTASRATTQKENSSVAALVAGSEASLRSNFARPQTRPQAALSNNRAVSRQMGATDPYATRRNLLFIPQNCSFLIANYPGGVPCPPNAFSPCCSCPSCC